MDRRLEWIVGNGAFAAALYLALVDQVDWIQYALIAVVWWLLVKAVWVTSDGAARRTTPSAVPPLCAMVYDLGVLGALFLAHWHWTAFAYAATCGCLALIDARRTSRP
jgi:hypothetical protein